MTDAPPQSPPRTIPRRQVISWAFWDWSNQPFNTVILTFVFTALYLVGDDFLPVGTPSSGPAYDRAVADLSSGLGLAITIAGIAVAVLAPVIGQRSDAAGNRKRWLAITTLLVAFAMGALFFVQADPAYFVLGVALVGVGSVLNEIAGVQYNALLPHVSTPATVGRISGLGWGLGYIGGILTLVVVVVLNALDWFGLDTSNGLAYRLIAVGCMVWAIVFAIPLFVNVPEPPAGPARARVNFFASYVELVRDIARIWRDERQLFWFLIASAVFRDGLAGVFTFGAVIASVVFHFSAQDVIVFGIAANLVAGVSTIISGRFDDRFGPRAVILTSLGALSLVALVVLVGHDGGQTLFWIFGLILCCFVGPAQAAARSLLARATPAGREGEVFGLYATTGRAVSFLTPALWTLFISLFGATYWGILGILIVLLAGLLLTALVRIGGRGAARS
ncbi:MFS transporter [Galbitalea sp. SE-J8]|uniref:MFS transporter n=1 Tax=Galbitalea sp. SE-J8 TaxID=3054952 RepID=UPI00259CE5FB|nr:MFS transporter [Galbitalea sp. SE-J8]MDM4762286.1 MFS transporter [Galbitalea sp. SE-J8]